MCEQASVNADRNTACMVEFDPFLSPDLVALGNEVAAMRQLEVDMAWKPEARPNPLEAYTGHVATGHIAFMGDFTSKPTTPFDHQ